MPGPESHTAEIMKRNLPESILALAAAVVLGAAQASLGDDASNAAPGSVTSFPKIDRRPAADDYSLLHGKLSKPPVFDPSSRNPFQMDLRSTDLSELDLRESGSDLRYATFDTRTRWPGTTNGLPTDFDPARILELGKNPGLGLRALHARGITGRGVSIAIIDQPLLVDHAEFANRMRLYEEINVLPRTPARMHGPAVASIAAGRSVGVAPEVDIYFIATFVFDAERRGPSREFNFRWYAQAVRRIVEINRQLPSERKIRALSLSIGWEKPQAGYEDMEEAVAEARKAGMLVTSSSIRRTHGVAINGLGREPMADPDRFESYVPGIFWADYVDSPRLLTNALLIPMDSRTSAAPTGTNDYVFYRQGGWSWITPYLAGVFALAAQVKPAITPEEFLSLALKTGHPLEIARGDRTVRPGVIINPPAIIDALEHEEKSPRGP